MFIHPKYRNRKNRKPTHKEDNFQYDYCLSEVEDINFEEINVCGKTRAEPAALSETHVLPSIVVSGQTAVQNNCSVAGWGRVESGKVPFFRTDQSSVQNLTHYMIFMYDDLHIIYRPRNVRNCKHSIVFNY